MTKEKKSASNQLLELVLIVAVAIGLALLIQAVLVKPYRIPSESMEPTLDVGQRVLVNRIGGHLGTPEVGDIVVFNPPQGSETNTCGDNQPRSGDGEAAAPCGRPTSKKADVNFIKRVVAGPGDTLQIRDGHVIRNGKPAKEPFARDCGGGPGCTFQRSITIPKDHYFMMGDNRGASDDSRFWGPVPEDWIIGGAFATYWPPKKLGFL